MTRQDADEFIAYLRNCTDEQVQAVLDKEEAAERWEYAALALIEMGHRLNGERKDTSH